MRPAKRRPSGEKLTRLRRNLARQRLDAQRGDAIALAPQHPEPEAVEGEALAHFGNRARLVNDQPGDGGRLLVRQIPVHHAVAVADRPRAVDIARAVRLAAPARPGDVVLVGD